MPRQLARLAEFSAKHGFRVVEAVQETGSGLHGRQALLRIFRNPQVQVIVVEHRDRLMPFGFEYLEAALAAQGRRVMVLDGSEITDDIVGDLQEVMVSLARPTVRPKGREEPGQESPGGHAVRVVLSHRIALVPSSAQEVLLRQAVEVSRFAYNWALAEWERQYQAGGKPGEVAQSMPM